MTEKTEQKQGAQRRKAPAKKPAQKPEENQQQDKKPAQENQPETDNKTGESEAQDFSSLKALTGEYQPGGGDQPGGNGGQADPKAKKQAMFERQLAGLNMMLFQVVAVVRDLDSWQISQQEADMLGEAEAACLPDDLDDLPPWIGLVMVGGMVVMPRLMADREAMAQRAKTGDKGEGKTDGD